MLPLTMFQALKIALADHDPDRLVVAGDLDAFAARRAIEDLREVLSGMRCLYSSSHRWVGAGLMPIAGQLDVANREVGRFVSETRPVSSA